MRPSAWPKVLLAIDHQTVVPAIAPLLISASRATDIPALMGDWFLDRFIRGFIRWTNPFSGKYQFVSFEKTRLVVFWSKYPAPFFPFLDKFDSLGVNYLFQLTINNYEKEHFEPKIPPLERRISAVTELARRVGKEKLLWRFDPIILTPTLDIRQILERIKQIGDQIAPSVSRLTVSFMSPYRSVLRNMNACGINPVLPDAQTIEIAGSTLAAYGKGWGIEVVTCSENNNLSAFGVAPGSCIDPVYIKRIFSNEPALKELICGSWGEELFEDDVVLRKRLKDPGQRPLCGCMISKDIGGYGTCTLGCVYCYAQRNMKPFTSEPAT